jgi:hypothetical protein
MQYYAYSLHTFGLCRQSDDFSIEIKTERINEMIAVNPKNRRQSTRRKLRASFRR